ncbi:ABC transporter substrate-binding protein [Defluviimonas sp. WL0024]|uniref:ABC transporter substrate-binding protein n=1 Tax=Albidovulum salinarum TaxID=2984153 RepID=A0ABT2X1I4_9RHOB|nr:CmpA/NrtA family ABC transporter substrate-binding protein [Defluviimonas sp. WL0024]MCU9847505.1 ABC transporter substrate-binding protein [Defluviimonas sp. WL0024]
MSGAARLRAGFLPLVDAAPLIVAAELGFADEEGVALDLRRAPSWSVARDWLTMGEIEAAHLLAPVPVAATLGLGGQTCALAAVMVMSVNGTVTGVSRSLAGRLRAAGHDFGFTDAAAAGRALIGCAGAGLRIGVPFPFSMHAELVGRWLGALDSQALSRIAIQTVPPPLMSEALAAGDIDAFCVGEPWGSIAVESGAGELLLPGAAIWAFAPEKVLAVRETWGEEVPDMLDGLIRAVWRAGRWLAEPDNHTAASELLARARYLDVAPEIIDRALGGRFVVSARGETRHCPGFVEFHRGGASFPWRSQAAWIGQWLARRIGMPEAAAMAAARAVFRSDLYRRAMAGTGAALPTASAKVEGAIAVDLAVASEAGRLILRPDRFFDGSVFDPGDCE